ncbi:MAG TPA: carboxypeptidase-like regulatory domain-containing protein, partial [Vicinamibacterales bacterium]|nr:carboxypeptidase-like regulatory domain-containing protein [Vicinamibacterales bacterium]
RPPTPDGAITLDSIPPGDYRVVLRPFLNRDHTSRGRPAPGPLGNAYVKSITLGRADVLASGLHLWGPTTQPFDIVVGLNGARTEGTATAGRDAAPGVTVVAVPDGANRGRSDLYRETTTDRQGKFAIDGLAPGDYTFYAWDDIERGAWESPEVMREFEGRGRFVRLHEGTNDAIELNVVTSR